MSFSVFQGDWINGHWFCTLTPIVSFLNSCVFWGCFRKRTKHHPMHIHLTVWKCERIKSIKFLPEIYLFLNHKNTVFYPNDTFKKEMTSKALWKKVKRCLYTQSHVLHLSSQGSSSLLDKTRDVFWTIIPNGILRQKRKEPSPIKSRDTDNPVHSWRSQFQYFDPLLTAIAQEKYNSRHK